MLDCLETTGGNKSADAWQGAQGRRHREVQNPVVPLTGHAYVETISAKGSTAQQKILNTRNGWKRNPKPSEEVFLVTIVYLQPGEPRLSESHLG